VASVEETDCLLEALRHLLEQARRQRRVLTYLDAADGIDLPPPKRIHRVTRLLEMVVEEVSLVDRAANKRRFLIVKRSDGMEDTTNDAAPVESDINAPAGDGETPGQDATPPQGANDDAASPSEKAQPNGPLAAAVAALEGLTEAVELSLSDTGAKAGDTIRVVRQNTDGFAVAVKTGSTTLATLPGDGTARWADFTFRSTSAGWYQSAAGSLLST